MLKIRNIMALNSKHYRVLIINLLIINNCYASSNISIDKSNLLLNLILLLLCAMLSLLINKIGQPAVLGNIIIGCIISLLASQNLIFFYNLLHNPIIIFLAELGSIFLLFEIGLESSLYDIKHAGRHAILVASIGVIIPFIVGYTFVTPFFLHSNDFKLCLFIGSVFAVTSTGISISVFKELGIIKNPASQIVLAASVIDDIIGLILLALITSLSISGIINIYQITITIAIIFAFFIGSFIIGNFILPNLVEKVLIKVSNEHHILLLILVTFALFMSWFAHIIGLEAIIGAFIAGLLLDKKYFIHYKYSPILIDALSESPIINDNQHNLANLIKPYGVILIPIFFIYAGMQINIAALANWEIVKIASIMGILAIFSKVSCCIFLPSNINKYLVGFGMVPRGEIGLIFAITGLNLKIIDDKIFSSLMLMILITSIITPIILSILVKKIPTNN